jgi:O-antigen/teichoic acid export membrane protein
MSSFVSSSVYSTLGGIVSLFSGFISSMLVARMLGVEGTGAIAFAVWIAAAVSTLANLGIPATLGRYMLSNDQASHPGGGFFRLFSTRIGIAIVLLTLMLVGFAVWTVYVEKSDTYSIWIWCAIYVLSLSYLISRIAGGADIGLDRFDLVAKLTFFGGLLQVSFVLVGSYFFGIVGAIVGYALRYIPQASRFFFYIRFRPAPGMRLDRKVNEYGRNEWLSDSAGAFAWGRIEILFLSIYVSTTELGYYGAGIVLTGLVLQLPEQMTAALVPHLGRHHDVGETGSLQRTYDRTTRWLSLMIFPVCFGGAAIMPVLLPLLFGDAFAPAVPVAALVVGTSFATALTMVPSVMIIARERTVFFLYGTPVFGVLSIVCLYWAVPSYGAVGAALSRAGVHTLWWGLLIAYCWRSLGISFRWAETLKIAGAALVCAAAANFILHLLSGILGLASAIAAGAIVYLALLRLLRCIPAVDVESLAANLPHRIPKRLTWLAVTALGLIAVQDPQASDHRGRSSGD